MYFNIGLYLLFFFQLSCFKDSEKLKSTFQMVICLAVFFSHVTDARKYLGGGGGGEVPPAKTF